MIEKYLGENLKKLFNFLVNEYYEHTSSKFGLHSFKEGKKYYRRLVKDVLFDGLTVIIFKYLFRYNHYNLFFLDLGLNFYHQFQ